MKTYLRAVRPQHITEIGGFVGRRFDANIRRRLQDPKLREEFIELHEKKNYTDWFWMGEQLGKWLEAAAYVACTNDDNSMRADVLHIVERLAVTQEEDGYIGITNPWQRTPVRGMQLYEWYYVLHGLLACRDLLQCETALNVAIRLGEYIIKTWGIHPGQFPLKGPFPGNGHTGGEGTLILEPMVRLALVADRTDFVTWCQETLDHWDTWCDQYPMSTHTGPYGLMKQAASGHVQIHEIRDNIHAHTFHMTLLGVAAMYEATEKEEYRQTVLGCIDAIAENYVFLTGGMSAGERYVDYPYYHPNNELEVCPQHTWILLLQQALEWTGDSRYAEEMERTLFNSLLAAQLADGCNWSYMTPMNGRAQEPFGPNCCNASGHRILARVPTMIWSERTDEVILQQWIPQTLHARHLGHEVRIETKTSYPSECSLSVTVHGSIQRDFALTVRIPSFAQDVEVRVNGRVVATHPDLGYVKLHRAWQDGDVVEIRGALPIRLHRGDEEGAISKGPLIYAYFQKWQDDDGQFHWIHGSYPGDVQLQIEEDWWDTISVEDLPEDALGPGLRIRARRKAKPPVFANPQANAKLPAAEEFEARLIPFVNQGLRGGHYAVFMPLVEKQSKREEVRQR